MLNLMENAIPAMNRTDLYQSLLLMGACALLGVAYSVRVLLKGRAHFSRVDQQGGSALLGKSLMEMGYWGLQPVARLLVFLHISPNVISFTALGLGAVAGASLCYGHFGSAAIFASVSFLLDALDGMVARMTGVSSAVGKMLDSALDRYVEFFFLAGLAVHYSHVPFLLILTLFAILGSFMVSYSTAKADALGIEPPRGNMRRSERATYLTLGAALSPLTIPWLERHREFGIALGYPMMIALALVALLSNVSAIERLYAIGHAIRQREEAENPQVEKEEDLESHSRSSIRPTKFV